MAVRVIGALKSSVCEMVVSVALLLTSTTGESPMTVMCSATPPTFMVRSMASSRPGEITRSVRSAFENPARSATIW